MAITVYFLIVPAPLQSSIVITGHLGCRKLAPSRNMALIHVMTLL
eukprot:CAMPEP_0169089652 /NCGR_PEP_ID=MMETSP1015-20121227/15399_1 /TAXON_ID=342587 /ORGANISM="Karlodinium micrum, Strain CCMP2283" /LENGTH=44 /DNA_ID= /DNA_START= /DNA_END= /DNA_ORIENTATION=